MKPTEKRESDTTPSTASTTVRGAKGPPALFSKSEIAELERLADRLQDPLELVDWAKKNSLLWLVTLNKLVHKGKGPTAIAQTAGVIEKLIKYTGEIMEVPRDHTVVQKAASFEDGEQAGDNRPGEDKENITSLIEASLELPSGD